MHNRGAFRPGDAAVERKGREGRKEILSYFASFATSAFDRDLLRGTDAVLTIWSCILEERSDQATPPWNAKAQPSLASDSASFGLAGAKAAKKYCLTLRPLRPLRSIVIFCQIHESSRIADGAEGEPLCAQRRDQSRGRSNSLTLILER